MVRSGLPTFVLFAALMSFLSVSSAQAIGLKEILENIRNDATTRGTTLPPSASPTPNIQPKEPETLDIQIPSDTEAKTEAKFNEIREAWIKREVLTPCDKLLEDDKRKTELLAFFSRVLMASFTNADPASAKRLVADGEALAKQGPPRPLIDLFVVKAMLIADDARGAALAARPHDIIARGPRYPAILKYFAANVSEAWLTKRYGENAEETLKRKGEALDFILSALRAGAFKPAELTLAFSLLERGKRGPFPPEFQQKARAPENKVDPWLLYALEGQEEIDLAWKDRGGDWGYKVTKKGWAGFNEHLAKARAALTKAWELRPTLPQAAAAMITVSMGDRAGEEALWFNRAVKTRLDYEPAYNKFLWSIFPRWGGSQEQMLLFGEKCLATQRYDTTVPYFYLIAVMDIAGDSPYCLWKRIFRYPGVIDHLEKMLANYLKRPEIFPSDRVRYEWALCEIWAGRYEKGRELLREVPERSGDLTCLFGTEDKNAPKRRSEANATIAAFTGPHKKTFEKAEEESFLGNLDATDTVLREALPSMKDTPEQFAFARDWIGDVQSAIQNEGHTINYRYTPLTSAVCRGDVETATFLLDNGADINAFNNGGASPLMLALDSDTRRKEFPMELLLKRGADPNLTAGKNASPPLFLAAERGREDIVRLLLKYKADPNLQFYGRVPLHAAVRGKNAAVVRALLEHGANPNIPFPNGTPALSKAIREKQSAIAMELVRRGADINAGSKSGWTPLMNAIRNQQSDVAKLLIEKGADVNRKISGDWDALCLAIHFRQPNIVKALIEKGANVNARTQDGTSALHLAIDTKQTDVAKLLMEHGADSEASP